MVRPRQLVMLAGACGALVAGCGSTSVAPAAYIAGADSICHAEHAKLARLAQPTTPAEAVVYLPPVLAIIGRETQLLGGVDAAPPARAQLADALATTRRLRATLNALLTRLRHGMVPFTALVAVQTQSASLRAQIDTHFRAAGLRDCDD